MANAKKLTEPQIAALRAAAKGTRVADAIAEVRAKKLAGRRERRLSGFRLAVSNTVESLKTRGLIVLPLAPPLKWQITPAGRAALFEATGEHFGPALPPGNYSMTIVAVHGNRTLVRTDDGHETVIAHGPSPLAMIDTTRRNPETSEPLPAAYGSGSFDDPAWDDPRLTPLTETTAGNCVICGEHEGHDLAEHARDTIAWEANKLPAGQRSAVRRAIGRKP